MQSDRGVVLNATAHPQSAAAQPGHRPQGPTSQCLSRRCPTTGVAVRGDLLPPGRDEGSLAGEGMDPHCLGRSRELLLRGARAALLGLRGLRGRETLGRRAASNAEGLSWPPSRGDPAKHGQPGARGQQDGRWRCSRGRGGGLVWVWGPERGKPGRQAGCRSSGQRKRAWEGRPWTGVGWGPARSPGFSSAAWDRVHG